MSATAVRVWQVSASAVLIASSLLRAPGTVDAADGDVTISDWQGRSVTAARGVVDSGGVKFVYHAAGSGPLVIFVHSITGPWFDFRHQLVALSERYRVIAMSTRGTDESDKPVGVEHYTSAKIAGDIVALIDHFNAEKATIVGQDSGGLHAWHFAMTHPERTERLISLGSIHPAGLIRELIDNSAQQKAGTFQRGMQENPSAGRDFGALLRSRPAPAGEPADLAALRAAAYARTDPESIVGFYKANWPSSPVTAQTEAFGFRLGDFPPVTVPTLFIYGRNSPFFLNETLNDMWTWVDAPLTIQILPDVGHAPHTEAPGFVTPRMLEWLETGR